MHRHTPYVEGPDQLQLLARVPSSSPWLHLGTTGTILYYFIFLFPEKWHIAYHTTLMLMLDNLYRSIYLYDATTPKMPMPSPRRRFSSPYRRRLEISLPHKQTHFKSCLAPPLSHRSCYLCTFALSLTLEIESISSTYTFPITSSPVVLYSLLLHGIVGHLG